MNMKGIHSPFVSAKRCLSLDANLYVFVTMPVDDKGILNVYYGIGRMITDEEIKEEIAEISGIQEPIEVQKLE